MLRKDDDTHVELTRTQLALEVLRLLVLQQDCSQLCSMQDTGALASHLGGGRYSPLSSSNSRSQYQHHGLSTCVLARPITCAAVLTKTCVLFFLPMMDACVGVDVDDQRTLFELNVTNLEV